MRSRGVLTDIAESWRVRVGRIGQAGQAKDQRRKQQRRYLCGKNHGLIQNHWHGCNTPCHTNHGFGIRAATAATVFLAAIAHAGRHFGCRYHLEGHGAGLNIRQAHAEGNKYPKQENEKLMPCPTVHDDNSVLPFVALGKG